MEKRWSERINMFCTTRWEVTWNSFWWHIPEAEASQHLEQSSQSLEIPGLNLGLGGCWAVRGKGDQSKVNWYLQSCCGKMACIWTENGSGAGGSVPSSSHWDCLEEAAESKQPWGLHCVQQLARSPAYLWFMYLVNRALSYLNERTHRFGIKAGKCFWKNRRCAGWG